MIHLRKDTLRSFGPDRHQRSVSPVKMANAVAGSVETVTLTVTRLEAGGVIVSRHRCAGSSSVLHAPGRRPTRRSRRIPLRPPSREAGRMVPSGADRSVLSRLPRLRAHGSIRSAGGLADAGSVPEGSARGQRQFPRRGVAAPSEGRSPPFGSGRPVQTVSRRVPLSARATHAPGGFRMRSVNHQRWPSGSSAP
jgi:hypothetical protein